MQAAERRGQLAHPTLPLGTPSLFWPLARCCDLLCGHLSRALLHKFRPKIRLQDSHLRQNTVFSCEVCSLNKSKKPEKQMLVHNVRVERDGKTDVRRGKRCWIAAGVVSAIIINK